MAKRPKEELVAGLPMRRILEFLCRHTRMIRDRHEHFEIRMEFSSAPDPDKVVEELTARGWLEKTRTGREVNYRYQLTRAGRRLAEELAHLFKWPAAQSRIRPAPRFRDRLGCLVHLHTEFARLKIGDPERTLAPYQRAFLQDLEDGLDEEALAAMHDWWNYNMDAIAKRGRFRRSGSYGVMPAPPRVDVSVFLSSKENLIVEWRPSGMQFGRLTPECDWAQWEAAQNRGIAFHTRPSNELLFIHDVSYARRQFPGMYDHQSTTAERVMVDSILLQAARALVEEIKRRLDLSFEVRMVTDIFTEWEEVESTHWPDGKAHVLASWRIENLEERKKTQELAELKDLKKVCPVEAFATAWGEADTKKRTGPPPSPESKPDRVSKSLKQSGHQTMTPSAVRRYADLLDRHQRESLPRPPPDPTKVVPFKKPKQ